MILIQKWKEVGRNTDMKAHCILPTPSATTRMECLHGRVSTNYLIRSSIWSMLELVFIHLWPAWEASRNRTQWRKKWLPWQYFLSFGEVWVNSHKSYGCNHAWKHSAIKHLEKSFSFSQREAMTKKETGWISCNLNRYWVKFMSLTQKM